MKTGGRLTPRVINHILMWADYCLRSEGYKWGKSDANIAAVLNAEAKKSLHEDYMIRKENGKFKVPFHLT